MLSIFTWWVRNICCLYCLLFLFCAIVLKVVKLQVISSCSEQNIFCWQPHPQCHILIFAPGEKTRSNLEVKFYKMCLVGQCRSVKSELSTDWGQCCHMCQSKKKDNQIQLATVIYSKINSVSFSRIRSLYQMSFLYRQQPHWAGVLQAAFSRYGLFYNQGTSSVSFLVKNEMLCNSTTCFLLCYE